MKWRERPEDLRAGGIRPGKGVGTVFRRQKLTRAELVRREFGEGFDHLMQAAAHAAGGVGATVGPRAAVVRGYLAPGVGKVRESTVTAFAPIAVAAKQGSDQAKKANARATKKIKKETSMSRKRWPMLAGLLAAGAAVGAASALVMRRRKRAQWDEYDPSTALDSARSATDRAMDRASAGVDKAKDAVTRGTDKASEKVGSAADKSGERLSSAMSATKDKAESATDTAKRQAGNVADKADELIGRAGQASKNSRT